MLSHRQSIDIRFVFAAGLILFSVLEIRRTVSAYVPSDPPLTIWSNVVAQTPDISFNNFNDLFLATYQEPVKDIQSDLPCDNIYAVLSTTSGGMTDLQVGTETDCKWRVSPKAVASTNSNYWMVVWVENSPIDNQGFVKACSLEFDNMYDLHQRNCWTISQGSRYSHANPDIGVDITTGNFLVVWEEAATFGQEIHGRLMNTNGFVPTAPN